MIEHKELKFDRVDVDDAGTIEGYASTYGNVDYVNDEVMPGAFSNGLAAFLKRGFIGWQHDMNVPIAYPVAAHEDARGLYVSARFHSTPEGQRARTIAAERVAAGKTMSMSIGYTVRPNGARKRADGVRELRDLELHEVSLVLIPANDMAVVTAVKSQGAPVFTEAERHAIREHARTALARASSGLLRGHSQRVLARVDDLNNVDFVDVHLSQVPAETRSTVTAVLAKACADLGIAVPRVRYFRHGLPDDRAREAAIARKHGIDDGPIADTFRDRKELRGQAIAARDEIRIRADLTGDDLVDVVAHEAKHIAQDARSFVANDGGAWAEQDARAYSVKFRATWGAPPPPSADHMARAQTYIRMAQGDPRYYAEGGRTAMRTEYENKAIATNATPTAADVDDARAARDRARAKYDDAIARRDALVAEHLPTLSRHVMDHPRIIAACGAIETARDEYQAAAIHHTTVTVAHQRAVASEQATADRARVDQKRELRRARDNAVTVGSRLRRLIDGVLQ